MSRWKCDNVTEGALRSREWAKTETGKAYRKKHAQYIRTWRIKNRDKNKEIQKRSYHKIRLEILTHYSEDPPKCACCGETGLPFLTLDHIEGDGAKQRRAVKEARGNGFFYWLKKNAFPSGIQVLCANCNFAKRVGPCCPHQLKNEN